MKKSCSVKGCFEDNANGDNLLCFNCRTDWIEFCKIKGVHEILIPLEETNSMLNDFQEHRLK